MTFIETMRDAVERLAGFDELCVDSRELPAAALGLSDRSVRESLADATGLVKQATLLQSVLAGVAATRSSRDKGHGGLVQDTGHRNTTEYLRDLGGVTRGEANRIVKVGQALIDGARGGPGSGVAGVAGVAGGDESVGRDEPVGGDERVDAAPPPPAPWFQPLSDAVLTGALTTSQHEAIRRGLGDPPATLARLGQALGTDPGDLGGEPGGDLGGGPGGELGGDTGGDLGGDTGAETVARAWRAAAVRLIAEAPSCTVEDLGARARVMRDMLDPQGAEARFAARFAKRSYRSWKDADGVRHGHLVFDDEFGPFLDHVFDIALAPRRGGPRFFADDERAAAQALADDPRTNEQLAYDLLVDLIRAGAAASHDDVYGSKQAGVRLVVMKSSVTGDDLHRDTFGRLVSTAASDDGRCAIPGSVLERALCATGAVPVTIDPYGNPLDVGREARLFTPKQKTALAVRDGGCMWPGCDRPPAYSEAHHCFHWADGGRTDTDDGILLCRYHHLSLHNNGWRITREHAPDRLAEPGGPPGRFLLHPPPGTGHSPIPLQSKSPLRWLFDPPPDRAGWRAAA